VAQIQEKRPSKKLTCPEVSPSARAVHQNAKIPTRIKTSSKGKRFLLNLLFILSIIPYLLPFYYSHIE
jgi:hypothetical protein